MAQRLRRAVLLFLVAAAVSALNGCWVYSMYPLATADDDLIYDKLLAGNWWTSSHQCAISFARFQDERGYRVQFESAKGAGDKCWIGEGQSASYVGTVIEISSVRFLDVYPADMPLQNHMALTHSFYRLKVDVNSLTLAPMDAEFIQSVVKDEKLRGMQRADEMIVLTANTKELREFIRQNATSDEVWSASRKLEFVRRYDGQ